ncbi:MAG: hypothetical protein GY822_18630, partial [Deltaproteobacteria bacterium]|nr:hypothetical protein [Deltaproteobacteria bacterium]
MLSTSRIKLRPLDEETLPLTVQWFNDARVVKTLLSKEPKTLSGQQAFLK